MHTGCIYHATSMCTVCIWNTFSCSYRKKETEQKKGKPGFQLFGASGLLKWPGLGRNRRSSPFRFNLIIYIIYIIIDGWFFLFEQKKGNRTKKGKPGYQLFGASGLPKWLGLGLIWSSSVPRSGSESLRNTRFYKVLTHKCPTRSCLGWAAMGGAGPSDLIKLNI